MVGVFLVRFPSKALWPLQQRRMYQVTKMFLIVHATGRVLLPAPMCNMFTEKDVSKSGRAS